MQPVNSFIFKPNIENFAMGIAHCSNRNCRLYVSYKLTTVTQEIFWVMRKVKSSGGYQYLQPLKTNQEHYIKQAMVCEENNLDDPANKSDRKAKGYMKLVIKIQVFEGVLSNSVNVKDVKLIFNKEVFSKNQIILTYSKSVSEGKIEEEKIPQGEKDNILEKQKVCIKLASLPIDLQDEKCSKELQPFWHSLQKLNWINYAVMQELPEDQRKKLQEKKRLNFLGYET